MHQNNAISRYRFQNVSGEGAEPLPVPSPVVRGNRLSTLIPLGAYGASILVPLALGSSVKIPRSATAYRIETVTFNLQPLTPTIDRFMFLSREPRVAICIKISLLIFKMSRS